MVKRSLGLSFYLLILRWTTSAQARKIAAQSVPDAVKEQRLGNPATPRPDGPLSWVHLCSYGEAHAVIELANRCREDREEVAFLLTLSDAVSLESLPSDPPDWVIIQHAPVDRPSFVDKFLDHWRPDVCVLSESELRVAMMERVKTRGLPLFLIDGFMSADLQSRWRWTPRMAESVLRLFDQVFLSDEASLKRFQQLGADPKKLELTGVLEEGSPALPCEEDERDRLGACLANRPVWLVAYANPYEINIAIHAHRNAMRRAHRLLLILVPDDQSDLNPIAETLEQDGWKIARRDLGEDPEEDTQILIADSHDEMGLWYRLAPVTFMGGSLGDGTGRNPFEPAALGSAILHGPNVAAYRASFDRLTQANAACLVANAESLSEQVERLLAPDRAAEMAHAAWMVCSSGAEVTDRVKDLLFDALDERERADASA